eukprot:CAMPEP_0113949806 /NCGR_PEP_ID=MMETSP1339-20121228/77659_1 /TAXON_ID=94617 /ORGANISM="Fibrocapsa japonica" /LENGTH=189 /DNA_ID=CAMNT_0000957407 /DNA_START=36 /DNA_END=602 /DNA_ORIENTATION=+ /assembly_acc=CAM_ASM_000762
MSGNAESTVGVQLIGRVSEENCHPFKRGRYTFMHNGGVPSFTRIRRNMLRQFRDEVFDSMEGTTDSEHIFGLFLNELDDFHTQQDPATIVTALKNSFKRLICLSRELGCLIPMSLNVAVTDGKTVVATRYRNSRQQQPPSLYYAAAESFHCCPKVGMVAANPCTASTTSGSNASLSIGTRSRSASSEQG